MFVMVWQLGSAGHPVAAGVPVAGSITMQDSRIGTMMNGVLIPGGNVRRIPGNQLGGVPRVCIPSTERR